MLNPRHALGFCVIAAAASFAAAPVAQATTIDLLASGTTQWSANSANTVFSLTDIQPAGSGVFNPFVRIQASPANNGQEQGYNTTEWAGTLQDAANGPANPLIIFSQVVDKNRRVNLALDYNESGNNISPIILEELILVVSTNPNKAGPVGTDPFSIQSIPADPGDVILYTMSNTTRTDAGHVGESFNIFMDANDNLATGNGGSGQADLLVQIDLYNKDLTGLGDGSHYLYVYSRFSNSQDGYEEWRIQTPNEPWDGSGNPPPVPEPASLAVLGLGAVGLLLRRR